MFAYQWCQVAGVHVTMLGCYVEYRRDSEQYKWLLQDLAGVDRGRTPWLVVAMHAPWCVLLLPNLGQAPLHQCFLNHMYASYTVC